MKLRNKGSASGSILVTIIVTISIMSALCAGALIVSTQTGTNGVHTAAWHQSLAGAEAAMDQSMNALNTGDWNGWFTVTGNLPSGKPTGGVPATAKPVTGSYNYLIPPSISIQGEGSTTTAMWTTIDIGNLGVDQNGNQPYRIRATGVADVPGPPRATMNKLDNRLRKISLLRDPRTNAVVSAPQAVRRVELIALPVAKSIWARALMMRNSINMSGGGSIDSFDSTNPFKSTNGQWDIAKRQNRGDVGVANSLGSDLRSTFIYGSVAYSGPAIKNTSNVQGTISTPFTPTIPDTVKPTWTTGTFTSLSNGNPVILTAGTKTAPAKYKIGSLTVSGGNVLTINKSNTGTDNNYIEVWVTGKLTVSGSGYITQDPAVNVKYFVEDDITVSGTSFNNQSGLAKNLQIVGIGNNNKVTISGEGTYVGTINAPGFNVTVSGSANLTGAFIANTLNISGSGSVHYDEALSSYGNSSTLGNYAYGSWFEDNAAPASGLIY